MGWRDVVLRWLACGLTDRGARVFRIAWFSVASGGGDSVMGVGPVGRFRRTRPGGG